LFVVGLGNRAAQRTVVTDRAQGPYWVVTDGLAAGEKVIVQGNGSLRDGDQVKAARAKAPAARGASPATAKKPAPEPRKPG
jgi:membrane fusion protein (multidrug efflux system)